MRYKHFEQKEKKSGAFFNGRKKIIAICLAALICVAVAGTIAFQADTYGPLTNTFKMTDVDAGIDEEFPDNEKKTEVTVTNDATADEFVRIAVVYNWKDADGNVNSRKVDPSYVDGTFNTTDWTKYGNYWYCNKVVKVGETTPNLIGSTPLTLKSSAKSHVPTGYYFSVDIISEAVQSAPNDALTEAWGLTAEDGELVYPEGD